MAVDGNHHPTVNVLIVAPHPDDEAIGCGGVIRLHRLNGDEVHTLYVTSGEKGCPDLSPEEATKVREREAGIVAQIFETASTTFWREPDGGVMESQQIVRKMAEHFEMIQPARVYVTHLDDQHSDHVATAKIVRSAIRRSALYADGNGSLPCWQYEVWTPLKEFDHVIDISSAIDYKRGAIRAHRSQDERNSFAEAALSLNHFRGLLSGPHKMYCEVFRDMPL